MQCEKETIVRQAVKDLPCPIDGCIRIATNADAEALHSFINDAYRENRSTYEPKYLALRVKTVDEIHDLLNEGFFILLTAPRATHTKMINDESSIVACVFIHHVCSNESAIRNENGPPSTEINMLTVHPTLINRGIARYMMEVAYAVAKTLGYTHMSLTVLSCYQYLLDMYARWGFKIVGQKTLTDCGVIPEKYPAASYFIVMEKKLL